MTKNSTVLYSEYIIDGTRREVTPAQMLGECFLPGRFIDYSGEVASSVVDESANQTPEVCHFEPEKILAYNQRLKNHLHGYDREVPSAFAASFTRQVIADRIIGSIWTGGHFSLGEIVAGVKWSWDNVPVGNMASFYFSVQAASEYLYDLGVRLYDCEISGSAVENKFDLYGLKIRKEDPEEIMFFATDAAEGFHISEPHDGHEADFQSFENRVCGDSLVPEKKSWLIYIPFDTCSYRLGGSLLHEVLGDSGDTAPDIKDSDYFIDCFEVVRELVEDGVILSGVTVSEGGLIAASDKICRNYGCGVDISGIMSAYSENDPVRVLFSEVPGVLIQINDADYDYVDSQLLLQDIAYYPIGQMDDSMEAGVRIVGKGRTDVMSILSALLQGQSSEGED